MTSHRGGGIPRTWYLTPFSGWCLVKVRDLHFSDAAEFRGSREHDSNFLGRVLPIGYGSIEMSSRQNGRTVRVYCANCDHLLYKYRKFRGHST